MAITWGHEPADDPEEWVVIPNDTGTIFDDDGWIGLSKNADVRTVAGQIEVSKQLLDQSPWPMQDKTGRWCRGPEDLIFADLAGEPYVWPTPPAPSLRARVRARWTGIRWSILRGISRGLGIELPNDEEEWDEW